MTALLINGAATGAGQRTASPAPAILEADGSSPALRFGEALRAHASDSPAQPAGTRGGGGLLATRANGPDLQIDDADILRQLTGTSANAAAIARTRATAGTHEAPSEDTDAASNDGQPPVSLVPLAATVVEVPSAPATAVSMNAAGAASAVTGAADARTGAARRDAKAVSLTAPNSGAQRGVIGATGATLTVGESSDTLALKAPGSQPGSAAGPRASDAALIAMNATAGGDQPASNVLASQSQSLLVALASGATETTGQKTVGTDKPADAQPSAPNRRGLVDALAERLSVQLSRGSSQATIRLDPPMMGTIEIVIRHDAAGVQVHLSATHGDVLRQLHGIGNALSQDLVQRNHGDVTVHVSDSSRDADGRQRNRQGGSEDGDSTPGHALRTAGEAERAAPFTLA